ncbi:hypothetical protein BIY24_05605 [Halobacteriovorax marinus]|uniref:hypothetical protein n=1 Tax=Halobacteriovorax marinus TaxID=97084 RepID=UPI000BC2CD54|nr:hypothetical protein [Halobacteriovorax marinus]ATH07434.1 hypothetical protein BIY24_05605 [Halobacteriovorax marinus]
MKAIILIATIFIGFNTFAASTIVHPFKTEFYSNSGDLNFSATLQQACRYEVPNWSDSAEYKTNYKKYDLPIKNKKLSNGLTRHTLELKNAKYLEVRGLFKPTKECMSEIVFEIKDANYSVGWANQFKRAISFKIWDLGNFRGGDTSFNISKFERQVENIVFSFKYYPYPSQVTIFLMADGEKISNLLSTSAAINSKTQMPYRLKR